MPDQLTDKDRLDKANAAREFTSVFVDNVSLAGRDIHELLNRIERAYGPGAVSLARAMLDEGAPTLARPVSADDQRRQAISDIARSHETLGEAAGQGEPPPGPNAGMLAALARIDATSATMTRRHDPHSQRYLEESRAGGMYGD